MKYLYYAEDRRVECRGEVGDRNGVQDHLHAAAKVKRQALAEGRRRWYCSFFGNPPGESEVEFAPSTSQSLFLMNEKLVLDWLKPTDDNLTSRVAKLKDSGQIATELYLSILTRHPDEEEKAAFAEYLTKNKQRGDAAVGELAWALLTSAEFRLNYCPRECPHDMSKLQF